MKLILIGNLTTFLRTLFFYILQAIYASSFLRNILLQVIFDSSFKLAEKKGGAFSFCWKNELFIFSTEDQAIGKITFINGVDPFDFKN